MRLETVAGPAATLVFVIVVGAVWLAVWTYADGRPEGAAHAALWTAVVVAFPVVDLLGYLVLVRRPLGFLELLVGIQFAGVGVVVYLLVGRG